MFISCNGKNIFIRWKMECSIQLGFASLNRTFHLSPYENILTIALINIHYLYTITLFIINTIHHLNLDNYIIYRKPINSTLGMTGILNNQKYLMKRDVNPVFVPVRFQNVWVISSNIRLCQDLSHLYLTL